MLRSTLSIISPEHLEHLLLSQFLDQTNPQNSCEVHLFGNCHVCNSCPGAQTTRSRITGTLASSEGCEQVCQFTRWTFQSLLLLFPSFISSKKMMAGKWALEQIQRVNLLQVLLHY
jgi:collagenase-like PrtC family protease